MALDNIVHPKSEVPHQQKILLGLLFKSVYQLSFHITELLDRFDLFKDYLNVDNPFEDHKKIDIPGRDMKEVNDTDLKHEALIQVEKMIMPCNDIQNVSVKFQSMKADKELYISDFAEVAAKILKIIESNKSKKLDEWKIDKNPLEVRKRFKDYIDEYEKTFEECKVKLEDRLSKLYKAEIFPGVPKLNWKELDNNAKEFHEDTQYNMCVKIMFESIKNRIGKLQKEDFRLTDEMWKKDLENYNSDERRLANENIFRITTELISTRRV